MAYIGAKVGTLVTAGSGGDVTVEDATPEVTLKNTTETDADGSRGGKITFKGEQSGGEESTLAQIVGSHDTALDNEAGDLIFKTNDGNDGASPSEVLRLDSAGRVGVGTTPAAIADSSGVRSVQLGATFLSHFTPDQDGTTSISNNVYWDGSNNKALFTGPSTSYLQQDRSHRFRTAASVSAGANASHVESVRIDHEGIKFNGDTAAANALYDYEEGNWTPATSEGVGVTSYNSTYIKVGRKVYLQFYLVIASNSNGNVLTMSGLPFTPTDSYSVGHLNTGVGADAFCFQVDATSAVMRLKSQTNVHKSCSSMSGQYMIGTVTYSTAS